jgi:cysteinyl-tRNA synthetase
VALGNALSFFGLDAERFSAWVAKADAGVLSGAGKVDELIAARAAARARKDFKESDRIRDELAARGVVLKDGKDADGKPVTTWEIAR